MANVAQGFPKLNASLVDNNGVVTQPWLQFFISLWNRTGGGVPTGQVTSVEVTSNNGITSSVFDPTGNAEITLGLGSITPSSVTASGNIVGANLSGNNSGDITIAGENYLALATQVLTAKPVDVSNTNITGILAATSFPALSGAISNSAGTLAMALANNAVTSSKIAANAVTPAKMSNSTADTLAGYDNTGAFSDVVVGSQLSLASGTLNTTGITALILTAKLTVSGTGGSMTFTNGILTAHIDAT